LGWAQKYDSSVWNSFATGIYWGKRIASMRKNDMKFSFLFDKLYGEKNAENFGSYMSENTYI